MAENILINHAPHQLQLILNTNPLSFQWGSLRSFQLLLRLTASPNLPEPASMEPFAYWPAVAAENHLFLKRLAIP